MPQKLLLFESSFQVCVNSEDTFKKKTVYLIEKRGTTLVVVMNGLSSLLK